MDPEISNLLRRPLITVDELRQITRTGKNATYAAIERGEIEVVEVGRRKLVKTAPLRRKLGLPELAA
jgi:hypothetical protein